MWAVKYFRRHCLKTASILQNRDHFFQMKVKDGFNLSSPAVMGRSSISLLGSAIGTRSMSTIKGRSMRSKVESRMRRETGKTMREIRRAKKLRKKLMTDEERLIYNLRRAKKKVALLLQKLKKYELPELPAPRHDPELLTTEQLQAFRKIGFKNRNYVPVGVRGVFGGVVQNMHLHWKFHETVQVCCDNFPKEKIKEMATMLARLSGGIVVNVHNVKTIIMFRGRNYRQPKNLIPINTLTKRKALFKARFEQALDSQKLNIKKIEQQLRRTGVNPEDPVAMASIQRVASTFFRAIDEKQGTPYVFHGDRKPTSESYETDYTTKEPDTPPSDDSDQEELDRFIAEIEDAADHEWAEEEAAEREEASKIRYWKREEVGMNRSSQDVRGREREHSMDGKQRATNIRKWDRNDDISEESEQELDSSYEMHVSPDIHDEYFGDDDNNRGVVKRYSKMRTGGKSAQVMTRSNRDMNDDSDGMALVSDDDGGDSRDTSKGEVYDFLDSDDDESDNGRSYGGASEFENFNEDDIDRPTPFVNNAYNYISSDDDDCGEGINSKGGRAESKKNIDEHWDSD